MSAPLTRGPRAVREDVIAFLTQRVPSALAEARTTWGLSTTDLPDPVSYEPYPSEVLDALPKIALSVGRSNNYARRGIAPDSGEEYEVRYACQVYAWLKFQEQNPTQQMRDDYATVLSGVLLATPSLGSSGAYRMEESTLEVAYSDVSRVRGDRYMSGVSLSFDLFHAEQVRRVPIGNANTFGITATVLSGHPGLD